MAWSVLRKATSEDFEALNKAARRFAARHPEIMKFDWEYEKATWFERVEGIIDSLEHDDGGWSQLDGKYLAMLWKRCVRRALNEPEADGIAYDTVGAEVN